VNVGPVWDDLVLGQGLAGTIYALSAIERGRRVLVRDLEPSEPTCSRVAAGLMNPIHGPRLALAEEEEACWQEATRFYRAWEGRLGVRFFEERPILRLFADPEQADLWRTRRASDPRYLAWHRPWPEEVDPARFRWFHGGVLVTRAGRLDTVAFLDAARRWLREHGAYERGDAETPTRPEARHTVWCLGHAARDTGPFRELPIRRAGGTILTVRIPGWDWPWTVHAGQWLLPVGEGVVRVGSTFEWDGPDPGAPRRLEAFLDGLVGHGWEPLGVERGIRPVANRGRPVLGRHPAFPDQICCNALGSRGASLAPWHVARLLDHLESGAPLPPECDVRRWVEPGGACQGAVP
jgi:glycine/D-amino acid oxidase-like deaminating enzyme